MPARSTHVANREEYENARHAGSAKHCTPQFSAVNTLLTTCSGDAVMADGNGVLK